MTDKDLEFTFFGSVNQPKLISLQTNNIGFRWVISSRIICSVMNGCIECNNFIIFSGMFMSHIMFQNHLGVIHKGVRIKAGRREDLPDADATVNFCL